jgi:hypothetical protein
MATPPGKKPIHAFLDEQTSEAFGKLCRKMGPTKTATVEALVRSLLATQEGTGMTAEQVWDRAREIAADRRMRGQT